jgi:tRNA A37 N6-isopentenylltransferase MiaA
LAGKKPEGRKIKPGIEGLTEEIELATRQLVKKQRTWLRSQQGAQWFKLDQDVKKLEQAFAEVYS